MTFVSVPINQLVCFLQNYTPLPQFFVLINNLAPKNSNKSLALRFGFVNPPTPMAPYPHPRCCTFRQIIDSLWQNVKVAKINKTNLHCDHLAEWRESEENKNKNFTVIINQRWPRTACFYVFWQSQNVPNPLNFFWRIHGRFLNYSKYIS